MSSSVPPGRFFRESKTLHRTTQELSMVTAELEAALSREESGRFSHILAAQQKLRITGAIALAVTSVFVREGSLGAIAITAAIVGVYLFIVLRMSGRAVQS